jgi:hypothetical protein
MIDFFIRYSYFLNLGVFIPFAVIIFRRKPLWSKSSTKLFSAYIILDVITWFLSFLFSSNNIPTFAVSNTFNVLEFVMLSFFYVLILDIKKLKFLSILISVAALGLLYGVFSNMNESFSSLLEACSNIVFIITSIIYYRRLLLDLKVTNLWQHSEFYLNTGIFFYFSCSVYIMVFANYFLNLNEKSQMILWTIHSVINLITYIIFATGLLKCKVTTK